MRSSILAAILASVASAAGTAQAPGSPSGLALVGADVWTMDERGLLPDHTILVREGRISALGPRASIDVDSLAFRVIDARGRTVLPGLIDAHVHVRESPEAGLLDYLRAGVTTVRDMNGRPHLLDWRRRIETGELYGPTLYLAAPTLGNFSSPREGYPTPTTADEGRQAVQRFHDAGYDWIKVYSFLPVDALRGVVAEAEARGLPVGGHVPLGLGAEAFSGPLRSIEHLTEYGGLGLDEAGRAGDEEDLRSVFHGGSLDPVAVDSLVAATVESGTWNVPTIVWFDRNLPSGRALSAWQQWGLRAQGRANRRYLVGRLHQAGANLAVGTDSDPLGEHLAPSRIVDELVALTEAGLTPFEALRAATVGGARLLAADDDIGTVAVGKRADLLVLYCDPTMDLLCLADIEWVVARGKLPVWEVDIARQRRAQTGGRE